MAAAAALFDLTDRLVRDVEELLLLLILVKRGVWTRKALLGLCLCCVEVEAVARARGRRFMKARMSSKTQSIKTIHCWASARRAALYVDNVLVVLCGGPWGGGA